MKSVYRYDLKFLYNANLLLTCELNIPFSNDRPIEEQILKIGTIRDTPSIWCLVDTNNPPIPITIYCAGTGWELHNEKQYLGSFIVEDCEIYHCFI